MITLKAFDKQRETKQERSAFAYARRAENEYARALKSVAAQIGAIVRGFELREGDPLGAEAEIAQALQQYAHLLRPWARATAARMLADVSRRDTAAWEGVAKRMKRALRGELKNAPTGALLREHLSAQVALITSLPLEAAQRVHRLTLQGIETSGRAKEIADQIYATGHVTKSRAMLIARTETARTASALTQARATYVGSEGYIWRTVGDIDVRKEHRKLDGKFIRWDTPPIASANGARAHAGQIYNCRCWPEPVIPEEPE